MRRTLLFAPILVGAWLAGCAGLPTDRGAAAVNERLVARGAPAAHFEPAGAGKLPGAPLTADQAVALAFERSPAMRAAYAELGLTGADVIAARQLPNPTLAFARLSGEGETQITRSLSLGFADLLLLPARSKLAGAALESSRDRVAASLQTLEHDVRAAWIDAVAAGQAADVAALAARASETSADYARRLDAAGNLPPRTLALEQAAAAEGRIAAARTRAEALRTRAALASLVGLSTREGWSLAAKLPMVPAADPAAGDVDAALTMRLDIAAARRESGALDAAVGVTKAWRWLGDFEVGYERETETDGARLRGPTFAWRIPLFNFNRDGLLRAQASSDAAHARLAALELAARNDAALAQDRMATARDIATTYRDALVPQREAATARTLEEVNYMLTGAFELLATRREQFAAYGEYVDAVRDYWLARVDLERALGARLPGGVATPELELPGVMP
ncbi:MAG TPA: TolC family protein [Steroidobacteraceae bacterium]|nr:TolC family protein [Steroidobacteraceae bacterium]